MNVAKNVCVHDVKTGALTCDKISGATDLTFVVGKGKWVKTVAELFTLDDKTKKYVFNLA